MRLASLIIILALLSTSGSQADSRIQVGLTDFDRLAANPPDPDRVTAGSPRDQVNIPGAIMACLKARDSSPDEARFSYQLGRVYFYGGQTEKALVSFKRAIDLDYSQAKFLVGLIMTRSYEGAPDDRCRVERLWQTPACHNHANA